MSIKCGLAAVAAALAALAIIGCATTADGVAEPSGPESAFVSRVDTLKAILPLLQGTEWHGRVQRWIDSK